MESNSPPRPPPFADNFGYKLDYIPPHSPFPPSTLFHPLLPLRCWTLQVNFIANFQVSFRVNQSGNCMQIARHLHPPRPPPPPPPPQQTPPPPQQQNEHKDILFQFHNLIFIHFLPIFFSFAFILFWKIISLPPIRPTRFHPALLSRQSIMLTIDI